MKKSIFLFFAAILCAISVSAGDGFYGIYIKYHQNGQDKTSDGEWTSPLNVGTLTTDFKITDVYLKVWWENWSPSPVCGQLHYWKDGTEVWPGLLETVKSTGGNNREIYAEGWNYVLASPTEASGKHEITYKWEAYLGSVTHTLPSNETKKITYTVLPPNPKAISCTSNGDGLGTEDSPFQVPLGKTLTISVDGEQAHADGNSVLYAKFTDAYTATLSHDIIPTKSKQSITISAKYHNATDNLFSSNEKTITVYYQAVEEENNDVLVSYKCGETVLQEESKVEKIGVSTATAVTAPSITNYTFSSWTLGSGVYSDDAKTANPISVITLSEGNYVMTANYTKIELTYTVKVPEGTENCYIAGSMNSWSFQKMTPTANANEFTITIDGATKDHKYKYVCGTDWKYVEVKANGENSDDRNYNATDVVERWNCAPGIHLVGEMTNWNTAAHKFQKASEEATTASVTLNLESGDYQFKVNNDGEWLGNNSEMKRGGTSVHEGGWTFESDKNPCVLKADIAGSYTFTWDITNKKLTVTYPELPKYTVTTFATEGGSVTEGSTYTQDTKITLTATANEGYEFVNWKDEETVVSTEASYTFTVTKDVNLTATFQLKSYEVSATATNGTVTGAGTYDHGTSVTLTATPAEGYTFKNWTVAGTGTEKSVEAKYTFTVTEPIDLVANFELKTYTVEFLNYDGEVLQSSTVNHGETPEYTGETPTKDADAQYTYAFSGWDPEIAVATSNQTYRAQYTSTVNKYTITFNNWNGTTLATYEVEYGQTPVYAGEAPTKAATAEHTYTFSGWDKEIVSVTGDVVYTAQFDATVNKYTITFNNWDGTTLATYEVEYGQTPVYAGEAPTKAATAEHTYTFIGWTPAIAAVTGEATYTATYSQTLNQHTITATATNGAVTGAGTYDHGTSVTLTATPDFDYQFVNWTVGGEVVSTANPYTFQATADVDVVANFQEIAATTEALSGKFSTGKYEYAEFATGNLQYKPSTNTWRFAKQQYQYVGKDNIYVGKEDYKGWIDLFGWSADDKFGVNPSNDNTNYQGEFVDWGTLFPEEGWSTLSKNQWNYLLNQRTNAASLKQIAMVGETLGIMLFPDEWTLPADCKPTKQTHHDEEDGEDHSCDFVSYNYTLAQWTELENAGAIFLPAAGRRTGGWGNQTISPHMTGKADRDADGHYKHYADYYAYYWTSTKTDGKVNYLINCTLVDKVKDTYTVHAGHVDWAEEARYGQSVRLAKVTKTRITLTTGDNSAVIAANIGKTVDVVIERSFTANDGYYTLCVPFNMPASVIGKAYSLGTVTEHVAGEGININLKEESELSAGMPYLVLPKANMSELVVEDVTIAEDDIAGQGVSNEEGTVNIFFQGYYSAPGVTTNGTTQYYVGNNGYLYNGKVEIRGLSGLFTITNEAGNPTQIRARVVAGENVETGMEDIITTDAPVKVIENGQLIIIRGGVKYNVQGQRL